jgi:hypothetical protein
LAVAKSAEIAFDLMGKLFGFSNADHSRYALERVKAAEQLVESRTVYVRQTDEAIERQQVAARDGKMFVALREVVVEKLGEVFRIGFRLGGRQD